jgi:hypothetical protein
MLKTISAIATAAVVAGGLVTFPSLSAQVEAHSQAPAAKADRIDIRMPGETCSQQAWPYLASDCLRDNSRPMGQARAVRVVSTDRTPVEAATAAKTR